MRTIDRQLDDTLNDPTPGDLAAYLAGELEEAERHRVEEWAATRPDNADRLARLRQLWETSQVGEAYDSGAGWTRLSQRLTPARQPSAPEKQVSQATQGSRKAVALLPNDLPRWAGYVVAVAVVFAASIAIKKIQDNITPTALPDAVTEYRTATGQRAKVTLPDSSTIILAPESRVTYATKFGSASNRTVMLEGQALFTVTHSAGVPFIVRTGNVATRVLGTSFAVRRYASDTAVQVIIAQGRVAIGPTVLASGDVAVTSNGTQVQVARSTAVGEQLAWVEDRLVFSHVPLRDIIPDLQRWFGLTVEVADPELLHRRLMVNLDRASTREAIELIAYTVKAHAQVAGNHVTLSLRQR